VHLEANLAKSGIRRRLNMETSLEAPPSEVGLVVSDNFFEQGREFAGHLAGLGGLKPGDRVLDMGCGAGRMAIPLLDFLDGGSYEGFDVNRGAIRWCQANITSRNPEFRFQAIALHSDWFNPSGRKPANEFTFPYPDATFDFVFAASLFTHLLESETKRYLAETRRVLKLGGRFFCTFFLFPKEGPFPSPDWDAPPLWPTPGDFGEELDGCRVIDPDYPTKGVAYREDQLDLEAGNAGLAIESTHYGYWSGRPGGKTFQDVLIGHRPTQSCSGRSGVTPRA
jgi:SAM-dependent methyltransferase